MKFEITKVESAFGGASFGNVGRYEKISGRAFADADPSHRLNAGIVNLGNAPRNHAGAVEYWFDFDLLKPVDLNKGNRRIFYDVNNRGNKLALSHFNDAPRVNDPVTAGDAGNGFLMRQGYAILWSGWQNGLPEGDHLVRAGLPIATRKGAPIVGINRDEFIFEHAQNPVIVALSYPANTLEQHEATLTVRQREADPRTVIAAQHWRYVDENRIEIIRPAAFDAGAIYEFIYPARDPVVMGLGFAAVRDFVAFIRHSSADANGNPNPLNLDGRPAVDYAIAYGSSQSGRFLRDFIWQGFNQDLSGGKVFDGVITSVGGSRKTFTNFEFAQPGRFSRQHEDHLFRGDQFPFSYATTTDPISGRTDGILARCEASGTCPLIMQTESSADFFEARSSLVVTDGKGNDLPIPDNVRIYLFASIQHGGASIAEHFPFFHYPANPLDYNCVHRALVAALDEWISAGVLPPASLFPRVSDGTLVAPSKQAYNFPAIPGVSYPALVNQLSEMDYGEQPPKAIAGRNYIVLVPKIDDDGNDIAGVRVPELAVPRGTHTGWNLRRKGFGEGELLLMGSYFPFAATREERRAKGDPRLSLEERYPSNDHYLAAIRQAADALRKQRLLLAEDVERITSAASARVGR